MYLHPRVRVIQYVGRWPHWSIWITKKQWQECAKQLNPLVILVNYSLLYAHNDFGGFFYLYYDIYWQALESMSTSPGGFEVHQPLNNLAR